MIQRKQSLYLLLAVVCGIACIVSPVASMVSGGIEPPYTMFNLWILCADSSHDFCVAPLFVLQLFIASLSMFTIFKYKNRKLQIRYCNVGVVCSLLWYLLLGTYVFYYRSELGDGAAISLRFGIVLPLIIVILLTMAKKGIKHDEALVRAADRIR